MDPHARKVAHDGEQARDREDGHCLAGGYEGPGAAGTAADQPAQHEEDGERLDHQREGVVADRLRQVPVEKRPGRPGAAAQGGTTDR